MKNDSKIEFIDMSYMDLIQAFKFQHNDPNKMSLAHYKVMFQSTRLLKQLLWDNLKLAKYLNKNHYFKQYDSVIYEIRE